MLGKESIFVRLCKVRLFYMHQFDSELNASCCTRQTVRLLMTEPSKRHYTTEDANSKRPLLLILGTGWGSYSVLKTIDKKHFDVIVVSPRNHFLFTPLLCSTTVGTLEFRSIIEPVRNTGFRNPSHFHQAEAIKLNPKDQTVTCRSTLENNKVYDISYDKLVIGIGALSNTFNVPGVKEHAFFLKEISDARAIRNRILSNFELALQPGTSLSEKKRLLHIVIVGGGPTGVEFGAELYDFVKQRFDRIVALFLTPCHLRDPKYQHRCTSAQF